MASGWARLRARPRPAGGRFLTQDTEFAELPPTTVAAVMIPRVTPAIPIARRVDLWMHAIDEFLKHPVQGRLFELLPDGQVEASRTNDL